MELRLPDFQCGVLPIPRAAAATYGLPDGELQETLRVILRTISAQKQWQAKCMGVDVPVLPVHTHAEKVLYFKVQRRMRQRLKWPPSYLETTREYNKCGSDYRLVLAGGVERSGRSNPVQTLKPDCYFKTAAHIAAYEAFCDRSENMRSTLHLFQPNEKLRAIVSSNTAYSNFEADASSTATSRRPLPSHSAAAARSAAPSAAPSAAITSPPGSTRSAAARRGAVGVSASNERPAPSADRSAPAPSPPSPPAPSPSASLPWQQAAVLVPPAGLPSLLPSPVLPRSQAAAADGGGDQVPGLSLNFQGRGARTLPLLPAIVPRFGAGVCRPLPPASDGGADTAAEPKGCRRCGACHLLGCKGSNKLRRCPGWVDRHA